MRRTRLLATLAVALAVVFAGCSGAETDAATTVETTTPETPAETADATARATTAADDRAEVTVRGGDLPVDETDAFHRVQELMGTDVRPQPVEVRNLTELEGYQPGQFPLYRYLGIGNLSVDPDEPGGVTTTGGTAYVHPGNGTDAEVERVLVHEYVHMIQYRANMLPWLNAVEQPRLTHDLLQTRVALVEGGAVYVTEAYADRYLDGVDPVGYYADRYRNGTTSAKYFYARYHFGYEYVSDRVDSPADLATVYGERPNTTEQLLHGRSPGDEPPAPLAVTSNATDEWSVTENDTMGELFVRVALRSELDAGTARSAATGWDNDALYGFTTGGEDPGFAWTLRFDSAADADEFASAASDFADRRSGASDAAYRVERVDDETAVLLFGNPRFVENATVSGSNANVTVSAGDAGASDA
jgi:hypothetical protein